MNLVVVVIVVVVVVVVVMMAEWNKGNSKVLTVGSVPEPRSLVNIIVQYRVLGDGMYSVGTVRAEGHRSPAINETHRGA